jgi:signal transduction histidine kinase
MARRYRRAMGSLTDVAPARRSLRAMLAALTLRRVAIALGLATLLAVAINPIFVTPFPIVLGRLLVIALVLLLAFTAAGVWHPLGLPGWLAQVIAVCLAAPLATLVVYLPSVDGQVLELFRHEGRLMGFVSITSTVLIVAPLLALGSLYRERDAQARSQALAFALEKSVLEKQALDAQLRLLQAQVEPHFLFNTLANVQELVESGSPRAGPVLRSLSAYLRAAVPKLHANGATLGDELNLVRAYLELMQMRMPDRLQWSVEVDARLHALAFPAMALLTLVENAVRHAIDPSEQGGRIEVRAALNPAGDQVRIVVVDTGAGLRETATPGTGLTNLRTRLGAFYAGRARLDLHENQPHGLRAELVLPWNERSIP